MTAPSIGRDLRTGASLGSVGGLATGDVGYLLPSGQVVVCGRRDDYLVANGRNVYAPAIEAAVTAVDAVRDGRATAVAIPTGGWIIALESTLADADRSGAARLRRDARRASIAVAGVAPDAVLVLPRGRLPLTSSGKLQRHEVVRRWAAGDLVESGDGEVEP